MLALRGNRKEIAAWYFVALLLSIAVKGEGGTANPFHFFFLILISTLLMLLVIKLFGSILIRRLLFALELAFLTLAFAYLLSSLSLPWYLSIVAPIVRITAGERAENASVAAIAGVLAGLVGKGMDPGDAALLLSITAVYDFIAVFITGHMKTIVRAVSPSFSERPVSSDRYSLGSGDVALPAVMASAAFKAAPVVGMASALAAMVGLVLLFVYVSRKPGILPALLFIAFPQLMMYVLLSHLG
ncbi:hypothetical protein JCM16138_05380 [Thermococcus atlanticus]